MKPFKRWLARQGLAESTITSYSRYAARFTSWMETEGIATSEAGYTDLLAWIRHRRSEGDSRRHIAGQLTALRWWFEWGKARGVRGDNPAEGLYLKGARRRLPHDLLEPEQLARLYRDYPEETLVETRNKTILGLLVWQGLRPGELRALRPDHLDLEAGTIRIPPVGCSQPRTLPLKSFQILELDRYQREVRPRLIELRETDSPKLILSTGTSKRLANTLQILARQLRRRYPFFTGFRQIRASVIAGWLASHNLRQVQYRAGHRWVSSTERYLLGGLEQLKEAIERYHPLSGEGSRS